MVSVAGGLSGCQVFDGVDAKAEVPIPRQLMSRMKANGMTAASPIMLRIFKQENVLEVWKEKDTGRYALLQTYEICKWSGKFGPKFKEGDKQAPEGFYRVNKHQMNPNSQYHLSFNMGFPNAYDRAHGRTGSHLMVHGACSSAGCYSMTDDLVEEIYALAREALRGGQKAFQVQAFPFRMTAENMFKYREHKHYKFWTMLKRGYDHFQITNVPPKVDVCNRSYEFNTIAGRRYISNQACPPRGTPQSVALAYTARQNEFATKFEALLAKSENREPVDIAKLTPEEALPGVSIIVPKKPEPVPQTEPTGAQTSESGSAKTASGDKPATAAAASASGSEDKTQQSAQTASNQPVNAQSAAAQTEDAASVTAKPKQPLKTREPESGR